MRAWAALAAFFMATDPAYIKVVEEWREKRLARLRADDGWLTVAGLHWLSEGRNSFPELPGLVWELRGGKVTLHGDGPARAMKSDHPGPPDQLKMGTRTMFVIERGGRYGIRVRDTESPYRKKFHGIEHYPVDGKWRVRAKWLPYAAPQKRKLATVIEGVEEDFEATGEAEFTLMGKTYRLEPVNDGGRLFFIFRDTTAGRTTYPAGRFLYSDLKKDGTVTLDFNMAYNPPCAFTPYATCPLPLARNRLPVAIEAGEKNYHFD
jgi:uncharacterized protein (DUF1684 family)